MASATERIDNDARCFLELVDKDHADFLRRIKDRTERGGVESPKIEVRYENICVEESVNIESRALPTLLNATLNTLERVLGLDRIFASKKRKIQVLKGVSGIIRPSRMTLLLGPPGAGKTTLLLALAGKLDSYLKVSGKITYSGHELNEFVPQRACAYVGPRDLLSGEMTVRETLNISGRFLGVGTRHDTLIEVLKREREAGVKPDPEIDAFMKATSISGQENSLMTDYVLKILGLENCADTIVGDMMRRGISGGEKKRTTIGEMLVGPAKVFFMDEISTGLDSSTTFRICNYMRQMVHILGATMITSLLQPAPETYDLFDDIILLSEGQIVYQGPRENILEFFEYMGFICPERKGVADFLQEVTSKKDQEQYWAKNDKNYAYVSVPEFVEAFKSFHVGKQLQANLNVPYEKTQSQALLDSVLIKEKYGISSHNLFKACFLMEWLSMKRNFLIYVFKTFQIVMTSSIALSVFFRTEMHVGTMNDASKFLGVLHFGQMNVMFNGFIEMAMTVLTLPVFYKQRDFLYYPAWAFALPICILRIPVSLVESGIWVILTYYTVGFAPAPSRFFKQLLAYFAMHQMSLSLFRLIGAVGRHIIVANTLAICTCSMMWLLGGVVVAKDDLPQWLSWGYYVSPMTYARNALVMNEFLDDRWSMKILDLREDESTIGKVFLKFAGVPTKQYWFWVFIGTLFAFSIVFNVLFSLALTYLNPLRDSKGLIPDEEIDQREKSSITKETNKGYSEDVCDPQNLSKRGMVLPFKPLSLAFKHVNYFVDMPTELKKRLGVEDSRLQLLQDVSGGFRPGILTAIVGVSGAGKTTLMDVLAGRKTGGYIEGRVYVSGYPKNQETFARISGYCEQNDIHSPNITVYESLIYSAWLRLSNIDSKTRKMFVEEIMELVELNLIRDAIVGLPGLNGLSTEQRKRLTIAVELVANPSIIFMDEPTSGLDARAASIVMRTVRNTVDTGRTVVCTIHQPSIDIFEAFDELLLMKLGGQVIYAGALGRHSHKLVEYFEAIPGISNIIDGYNPATWMLEVTSPLVEAQLNINFAEIYAKSSLYRTNQELIDQLSTPAHGSSNLSFPNKYSQPFYVQFKACFWKQHWSYWRNPQYNVVRFLITIIIASLLGIVFWNKGQKTDNLQDLLNLLGIMFVAVIFIGSYNANTVQPVVYIERTVFYRERAAGMYSQLPYAFAQVVVETIYTAIQSLLFTLILFSMFGLEWKVDKFLWFFYFISMFFSYLTLCGMMIVALTPGIEVASIVMSFVLNNWYLFTGFFIPINQIPIWWRWYYWGSPMALSIYGLVTSQMGDKNVNLEIPGIASTIPLKTFLKETYDFDYDFLPIVAAIHVAWVMVFFFVFAYGIKYLNFQNK